MVEIKPKFYGKFDCYQNNIVGPVSEYWNVDYRPVFWTEFNFIRESHHPNTFEEISFGVGNRFDRGTIWQDLCGVALNICQFQDIGIFKKKIMTELERKHPVVVTIDSNYLPWNQYFQIRPHCFLVCDFDERQNELLCCDGTFHQEGICRIDLQYIFEHYYKLILLSHEKVAERTLEADLVYFRNVLMKNNRHKYRDINRVVDDILHCWKTDNISMISTSIAKSYFLLFVTEVCNSRHNFMKGLEYFEHTYNTDIFSAIIPELINIRSFWDAFKGLFVKSMLSGQDKHMEKAVALLRTINSKEDEISQRILICCQDNIAFDENENK